MNKSVYDEIASEARNNGMSINAYMTFLVNLGRKAVHQVELECSHVQIHTDSQTV